LVNSEVLLSLFSNKEKIWDITAKVSTHLLFLYVLAGKVTSTLLFTNTAIQKTLGPELELKQISHGICAMDS
jgi:hypothetical protein